MHITQKEK
uniref:Uncharacterized protein n=1 Tax=Rhizophora mucronata TaxID=61149 RepID=A0A2P2QTX3_RHIMU